MVEAQKNIEGMKKLYFTWSLHDHDVRKEGMKEGLRKGEEAKALETAKKLLIMNVLSHEQVSQAVDLPLETIEELAQS